MRAEQWPERALDEANRCNKLENVHISMARGYRLTCLSSMPPPASTMEGLLQWKWKPFLFRALSLSPPP